MQCSWRTETWLMQIAELHLSLSQCLLSNSSVVPPCTSHVTKDRVLKN